MALRPCLDCTQLTNGSVCTSCKTKRNRARGSATQRGYDSMYQAMRLLILNRDGWRCYICGKALVGRDATVDHLTPLRRAPELRLDPSNMRACCRAHNSGKRDR